MNFKKYFSVCRILLLAVGLWPYQQSNLIRFQFICLFSILTTSVIFQCTVFISQKCTVDLLIKVLSYVFLFFFSIAKYYIFFFNLEVMKNMLEQLFYECNKLKDANEITIIEKYGSNGKWTTVIIILFILSILIYIVLSFWSDIFNVILSTNSSRHNLLIVEYFIDQEKYFYLILLHSIASICIALTVIMGTGTLFMIYFQLICGMFTVASYRIERAMSVNMLQDINLRQNILTFKGLICAVDIHRQAMKLAKLFQSNLEIMMFLLIIFGVLSGCLNMFQIVSCRDNIREFLMSSINTSVLVIYAYLSNYCAQLATDHNHQVFVTAYNTPWYLAPLYIQKMILFLLQKTSKTFRINIGGIYDGSIEGFATLVKTALSYFTVIRSTQ
ncbi:Odorant receptor 303 [Nylanderia fulva]|uniref:Odorant receptor n=1 Tax=Nylanderia fulva TaxID=613905 RepID=A0A6G1LPI5_9HYME|nr:Odorant receptor 303 [Nylanderia fulva]